MLSDSMTLWTPALLALLAALAWAGFFRWRRRPAFGGLGLPIAALIGVTALLGVVNASPRHLAERLPMVALGALLVAAPLGLWTPRWLVAALTWAGAAFCGWWMAGAPLVEPDLLRATSVILPLWLLVPVVMVEAASPWRGSLAAVALAAGLVASAVPGPWLLLALILAGAALGQQMAGGAQAPASARLPLGMLMAALIGGPILARGAPADWAAALAPLMPLLLGSRLGLKLKGWRAWPLPVALAALPVALAWWLARGA